MNSPAVAAASPDEDLSPLMRRITWRLVPMLMACYVVAFLDRINVGYAQLQMKQTLAFDDLTYGIGAGIFFLGYFLFEVPSNLLLARIGFRNTMLRIMMLWGIVAVAMAFVRTPTEFYTARFLLGLFEAGFFPGVVLYFTYWFPSRYRGQVTALFMSANAIGAVLTGPLCGAILKYGNGIEGLHGWQWLFILEGLPACALAVAAYFWLDDKPSQASWLKAHEQKSLDDALKADSGAIATASHRSAWQLLSDRKVYGLSLVYLLHLAAMYAMVFASPSLIKRWGIADLFVVGLLSSVPHACAVVASVFLGRHSDRTRERRWHLVTALLTAAVGVAVILAASDRFGASLAGLTLATMGWVAVIPLVFVTTAEYLPKVSAAAGIALVSSLGNLGGAVGPPVSAWLTAHTGHPSSSMVFVIACWILAAIVLLATIRSPRPNTSRTGRGLGLGRPVHQEEHA